MLKNFGNLKRDLNEFSEQLSFIGYAFSLNEKNPSSNYLLICKSKFSNFEKAILYS